MTLAGVPTAGRVHPMVVAKVYSEDKNNFSNNFLSAHTNLSLKAVLLYISAFALFMLFLFMLG